MTRLLNRCIFVATSAGAGDFVENVAALGFQTMEAAGAIDGSVYSYVAQSSDQSQWETGQGTWTLGTRTLARTYVLSNSAGTFSALNFTTVPQVMITPLSDDLFTLSEVALARTITPTTTGPTLTANRTFYLRTMPSVVTISVGSPAVVGWVGHGLQINDPVVFSLPLSRKHCTMTSAVVGVVTTRDNSGNPVAHGYAAGDPIQFTTTGALPTNVVIGTTYWVTNDANLTANTFAFSDTRVNALAGAGQINTTAGTQSGSHFVWRASTLPTGVSEGAVYYVIAAGFGANSFEFSASQGGAAVNTAGTTFGPIWAQTGNDSNNGLAQTRAGALLTPQAAWLLAIKPATGNLNWNFNGYTTTIQFADGTYTNNGTGGTYIMNDNTSGTWRGTGTLTWQGNLTDQDAVVILGTSSGDNFHFSTPFTGSVIFNSMCTICPFYAFANFFPLGPVGHPLGVGAQLDPWDANPAVQYWNMSWDGNPSSDPYTFNQGPVTVYIDGEHRIFVGAFGGESWMEFDHGGFWSSQSSAVAYFCNNPRFAGGIFILFSEAIVYVNQNGNFIGTVNGPKATVNSGASPVYGGVAVYENNNGTNNPLPGTAPVLRLGGRYEYNGQTSYSIVGFQNKQFNAIAVIKSALTLANGLNSNLNPTSGFAKIAGPSTAFSVGGFVPEQPLDGNVLTLYNPSTQAMTIVNEDAASSAANRITTLSGADLAVTAPGFVDFFYDATVQRWLVHGHYP